MIAVVVGDTLPALAVGGVLGLIILIGQVRQRRWHVDKISTRPAALTALGLLVYYGTSSANGALPARQFTIYLITLAIGLLIGVGRAWTLYMWMHPLGLHVKGSGGTLGLWAVSLVGAGIAYGLGHVGFGGLVLFEGVSLLSQQLATILRGARARPRLASNAGRDLVVEVAPPAPRGRAFVARRPTAAVQGK